MTTQDRTVLASLFRPLCLVALAALIGLAGCSSEDPTRPQLGDDLLSAAGSAQAPGGGEDLPDYGIDPDELLAEYGEFAPDEIDPSDLEYDGESAPLEHTVRVGNGLELVFRFNGPVRARENVSITLRVPGGGKAVRGEVSVDFGDGRKVKDFDLDRAADLEHTYRKKGRYRLFVILEADDGRQARGGFRMVVNDPIRLTLAATPLDRLTPGEQARVQFTATPAKAGNKVKGDLTISWGDGSTELVADFDGNEILTHTYETEGDYSIAMVLELNGRDFSQTSAVEVNDGPDELDMSQVVIMGNSAGDVANWTVTSEVTGVSITPNEICIFHTKAGQWPVWQGVEGNPWVVANVGGTWYAGTYEWVRPGQQCKGITAGNIGPHIKHPPLDGWRPRQGEKIYLFMSTLSRLDARSTDERSNVVEVIWPY